MGRKMAVDHATAIRCAPASRRLLKTDDCLLRDTSIADFTRKMRLKPLSQNVRHHKPLFAHSNLHFESLKQKSYQMGILNGHGI
jgi:hypothetical protein